MSKTGSRQGDSGGYYGYIMSLGNYETTLDSRGGGVLISYKKSER